MSEMDRAVFLQAIQADPADMAARLAWADLGFVSPPRFDEAPQGSPPP